jgi:hypothetical protein
MTNDDWLRSHDSSAQHMGPLTHDERNWIESSMWPQDRSNKVRAAKVRRALEHKVLGNPSLRVWIARRAQRLEAG